MSRPLRPGPSFLTRVLRRRPVESIPPPEPEVHEPAPEPDPAPQPKQAPRTWNLWELERVLRADGRRNEEHELLLLYLRDYAGPDGELPATFDALVRESFGDLLGAPAR